MDNLVSVVDNSSESQPGWDSLSVPQRIKAIRSAFLEGYITPELMGSALQGIYDEIPKPDEQAAQKIIDKFK